MKKRIGMAALLCGFMALVYIGGIIGNGVEVPVEESVTEEPVMVPLETKPLVLWREEVATDVAQAEEVEILTTESVEPEEEIAAEVKSDKLSGTIVADVTNYVNIRTKPNAESERVGKIYDGAVAQVLSIAGVQGDWVEIVSGNAKGYVKAEFFIAGEEWPEAVEAGKTAMTLEEEKKLLAEQKKVKVMENITFPDTSYTTNEELRQSIVDYALQFVGNVYINGGQSLVTGTDCSGFTCYIYKDFGYTISRIPQGQYTDAGRSIDYSEIQAGDIICYSGDGKSCTHVAMYIGGGQVVHAANSRKGVIVSSAEYMPIIGIRNVID